MVTKTDRPTDQVFLNHFYHLADFSPEKRLRAAEKILNYEHLDDYQGYVVDRLVKGLASGRTAARLGFSTVLTIFLSKHQELKLGQLIKLIETALPLDQDVCSNAVGQHFAFLALNSVPHFGSVIDTILEKHLNLVEVAPFLELAVAKSVVDLAQTLKEDQFKKLVLPRIKKFIAGPLIKVPLIGLVLLMGLSDLFVNTLKGSSECFAGNKILFRPSDYEHLADVVKGVDIGQRNQISIELLNLAKKTGQFRDVYDQVVEKVALNGDEAKGTERYFSLLRDIFLELSFDSNECLYLLSDRFIVNCRKYSCRSDPLYRGHQVLISEVLTAFLGRVHANLFSSSQITNIIDRMDAVESGDFDSKVGLSTRFTEVLVSKMDSHDLEGFAQRAVKQPQWSLKRLIPAFGCASPESRKTILKVVANVTQRSEGLFNVGCALLNSLFKVYIKKNFQVSIEESDIDTLLTLTNTKEVERHNKSLAVFAASLRFLSKVASTDATSVEYTNLARQVCSCGLNGTDLDEMVDVILNVITKQNKVHRHMCYYAVHGIVHLFNEDHVQVLIEAVGRGSADDDSDDEGDGDFKPISEEERQQVLDKWAKEGSECVECEDEEIDDNMESDDDVEAVDEGLVDDMKKALGKFAIENSDDDDYELHDEALNDLDIALGAALKKHTQKGKKEQTENIELFRSKCADLLSIVLDCVSADVLVKLFGPLAELIAFLDTPGNETALNKVETLLQVVHKRKKGNIDISIITTVWEHIVQNVLGEGRSLKGRRLLADLLVLLLAFSAVHSEQKANPAVVELIFVLARAYALAENPELNPALKEVLNSIFFKYPHYLTPLFPKIAQLISQADLNNKVELVRLLTFALRKDVLNADSGIHTDSLIKTALPQVKSMLESVESLKPNQISRLVVFVYKLVNACSEGQQNVVKAHDLLEPFAKAEVVQKVNKAGREIQAECKAKPTVVLQKIRHFFE